MNSPKGILAISHCFAKGNSPFNKEGLVKGGRALWNDSTQLPSIHFNWLYSTFKCLGTYPKLLKMYSSYMFCTSNVRTPTEGFQINIIPGCWVGMYMDFTKVYRFTRYFLNPLFTIKIEAYVQSRLKTGL